jgi:hypothetical protein
MGPWPYAAPVARVSTTKKPPFNSSWALRRHNGFCDNLSYMCLRAFALEILQAGAPGLSRQQNSRIGYAPFGFCEPITTCNSRNQLFIV